MEYSPFALDIESPNSDVLDTCRELGIAIVAYSPIGRGLLTGQIKSMSDLAEDDFRRYLPKYSEEHFPKIQELVEGLKDVAKAHSCSSTQVAIAWLLAQGSDIIPIPGTRTTTRMDENNASAQIQLSSEEVQKIRELVKKTEVPGTRYPEM